MSERWVALLKVVEAVTEGDPDARACYDEWRMAVARDTVAEMAENGASSLLCGPFPEECTGRLRVNGMGVDCPRAEECDKRLRRE